MLFLFKKVVGPLLLPLNLGLEILFLGLLLVWFTRRQRLGKLILTAGFLLLVLLSYRPVADRLLGSLEWRYRPVLSAMPATVSWIVVLGAGHSSDHRLPDSGQLTTTSLARVVEGVRLQRQVPGSKLLVSGGGVFDRIPDARLMAATAAQLGVPPGQIMQEDRSRDTEEEAMFIKPIVRTDPFLLVTSAAHMPRSMALFRKQGMNPTAAPTDFLVHSGETGHFNPRELYPGGTQLLKSENAVYEYLGIAWSRILGHS